MKIKINYCIKKIINANEKWVNCKYSSDFGYLAFTKERTIEAPNYFSEFTSNIFLKNDPNRRVITGLPNRYIKPDNGTGEDILSYNIDSDLMIITEVKGNGKTKSGNPFKSKRFNSLLSKSLSQSFGYNETKKNSILNETIQMINKPPNTQDDIKVLAAAEEILKNFKRGKIDLKNTESHIYTAPVDGKTPKEISIDKRETEFIGKYHNVIVFDTSEIIGPFKLESKNE